MLFSANLSSFMGLPHRVSIGNFSIQYGMFLYVPFLIGSGDSFVNSYYLPQYILPHGPSLLHIEKVLDFTYSKYSLSPFDFS